MTLRPEQVRIVCDRREQAPFDLSPLAVEPGSLRTGDYALAADLAACIVERKSGPDLLACIGSQRERFTAELERLRAFPARVVVVECGLPELLADPRSRLSAESVIGTLAAWSARYTPIMLCGSRNLAQDYSRRFLFNEARRIWKLAETFRAGMDARKEGAA